MYFGAASAETTAGLDRPSTSFPAASAAWTRRNPGSVAVTETRTAPRSSSLNVTAFGQVAADPAGPITTYEERIGPVAVLQILPDGQGVVRLDQ